MQTILVLRIKKSDSVLRFAQWHAELISRVVWCICRVYPICVQTKNFRAPLSKMQDPVIALSSAGFDQSRSAVIERAVYPFEGTSLLQEIFPHGDQLIYFTISDKGCDIAMTFWATSHSPKYR